MNKLTEHRKIWKEKKNLRVIYSDWYKRILKDIKYGHGKTIELGGGGGNFKEFKPDTISSDIEYCKWLDICFDAHNIPLKDESVSNILLIDVLHHLSDPVKFLIEAFRILESKGRIILLEPYPSPFSLIIYRLFHNEPFLMNIDYFTETKIDKKDPWQANQAIPYLLFFKEKEKFLNLLGDFFTIIKVSRISFILYPASGGFGHRAMIPDMLIPLFKLLEILLKPFDYLLAFRCYIVLERK